jgi:hypothetical protein
LGEEKERKKGRKEGRKEKQLGAFPPGLERGHALLVVLGGIHTAVRCN